MRGDNYAARRREPRRSDTLTERERERQQIKSSVAETKRGSEEIATYKEATQATQVGGQPKSNQALVLTASSAALRAAAGVPSPLVVTLKSSTKLLRNFQS